VLAPDDRENELQAPRLPPTEIGARPRSNAGVRAAVHAVPELEAVRRRGPPAGAARAVADASAGCC